MRRMLSSNLRARRTRVNRQDVAAWRKVKSRSDWEAFRDRRIAALRKSLGTLPAVPGDIKPRTTGSFRGDGFRVDNIVFESRPDLWVTANLYSPAGKPASAPGLLICHSHHNPKTQGELQDMGMTWARLGCYVLVLDQVGHGERRQHPFKSSRDYAKSFRVSRQDYYFRYNVGIHLHLAGESLAGWMAWDMMRCVDVLLQQPGIDSERIALLGAVAGGGDPAAITAALDRRITAVVPFNFGGPQPENVFPLPKDAELSFNYMGGGSWESTRNLRQTASGGFLPWVIVGAAAPRRLIYAHEFSWDRERDPVWKRYQQIYAWYGVPENLDWTKGYGRVTLSSREASHCNNIGPYHRKRIHAAFAKWFKIPAPKSEYRNRVDRAKLYCIEGVESAADVKLTPVRTVADRLAGTRLKRLQRRLHALAPKERASVLREGWARILGDVTPAAVRGDRAMPKTRQENGINVVRTSIEVDGGIRIPLVVLTPGPSRDKLWPVVICVAQEGKAGFLKHRSTEIARLLNAGIAVCLADVRGTGESSAGSYRGRRSNATGLSSLELLLGGTQLGLQLKDLRAVLQRIRGWEAFDRQRMALWGDSFARMNAADRNVAVPLRIANEPDHSEPLGHLLVLLGGLFESDVAALVSARGGVQSYRSVLQSPYVYLPHDAVVPGAIPAGDLPELAAAMAPRPLWIAGLVDGENKRADAASVDKTYAAATKAYARSNAASRLAIRQAAKPGKGMIAWLIKSLPAR